MLCERAIPLKNAINAKIIMYSSVLKYDVNPKSLCLYFLSKRSIYDDRECTMEFQITRKRFSPRTEKECIKVLFDNMMRI